MDNNLQKQNRQQVIEHCLYALQKMNKPDAKRMTLLLYLAEQHHLVNWGLPLLKTKFTADKDGPGLNETEDKQLVPPLREADIKWLSRAAQESIDQTIIVFDGMDSRSLCAECRGSAWSNARCNGQQFIDKTLMAEEAGANRYLLEYIKEQQEIDDYFNS